VASKNIVLKGTTYNGVESITLPTSPSGTATFYEVSDTTATASDVLNSKYFYTAAGVKTQGTGTAPSPTLITKNITQNGTYDAEDDDADGYSSVTVNVSGGSGLVYETGTWTPSENIARGEILFSNTHTVPPMYAAISDSTGTAITDININVACAYVDFYRLTGSATDMGASTPRYGLAAYTYRSSGTNTSQAVSALTTTSDDSSASSASRSRYWATPTAFYPYTGATSRYWMSNRSYKWIAVWAPTT